MAGTYRALPSTVALGLGILACGEPADPSVQTRIEGRVEDASSGEPLAGVDVRSSPRTERVTTGADGRFVLRRGVRFNQRYRLNFEREDFVPASADVTPRPGPPSDVVVRLNRLRVCEPGARRCAGGNLEAVEVCSLAGSGWTVDETCGDGLRCFMAACAGTRRLAVTTAGGLVLSEPAGISCNPTCEAEFPEGQGVTLTAQPFVGSSFQGWSGDCAGAEPTCTVNMDADRAVQASFLQDAFPLEVQVRGNGLGRVTSDPPGVDCTQDCNRAFDRGETVTLTASPESGFEFEGWGGDCSGGSTTCTLVLDGPRQVVARFVVPQRNLEVQLEGPGAGTVQSSPSGISCAPDCSADFDLGTEVELTASAAASNTFAGWGGDCSGMGACTVTLDGDRTVTARFEGLSFDLEVVPTGDGMGSVTSDPAGIDCGPSCLAAFADGTSVELTAMAGPGNRFEGWSGDCTGPGACTVALDRDRRVEARFEVENLEVSVGVPGGGGRVVSVPAGIDCPGTCAASFASGTLVELQASPDAGQGFAAWSGDCASAPGATCSLTVDGIKQVEARFEPFHLLPLPADMGCVSGLRFEGPNRLQNACGMGTAATAVGTWTSSSSRNADLSDAYEPGGAAAALDTGVTLAPPTATVELTVRRDADRVGEPYTVLVSSLDAGDPEPVGFELRAHSDGRVEAVTRTRTASTTVATSTGTLPLSTWRHVAASVRSDRIALWVDGVEAARTSTSVRWTASSSTSWVGAGRTGGSLRGGLDGRVDEVRISDVARY
jgi:hypothetical protein